MAFWIQIPPTLVATTLVIWKVHVPHAKTEVSAWKKFCRIDWAGSVVLLLSVGSTLVGADPDRC